MIKIKNTLAVLIGILMLTTVCSAVSYSVGAPHGTSVAPGGSIDYVITVSETGMDEYFDFSVDQSDISASQWSYAFDPQRIFIPDLGSTHTTLTFTVPRTTQPGPYQHRVYVNGFDPSDPDPNNPQYIDLTTQVVQTNVSVPEFPTVAAPVMAILGLVAIFGRRKSEL